MGCCQSSDVEKSKSSVNLVKNPAASSNSPKASGGKEDQIALAFKAKRANVFTQSVDIDTRRAFSAKNIPKTPKQETLISTKFILNFRQFSIVVNTGTALAQNFVFDSLDEMDLRVLVNAMEIVQIAQGENVITQGDLLTDDCKFCHFFFRGRRRLLLHCGERQFHCYC
jgi:hypothetical protein